MLNLEPSRCVAHTLDSVITVPLCIDIDRTVSFEISIERHEYLNTGCAAIVRLTKEC